MFSDRHSGLRRQILYEVALWGEWQSSEPAELPHDRLPLPVRSSDSTATTITIIRFMA